MSAREKVKICRPKMKVWLSSPEVEGAFGDGKWRLLQAIKEEGSLRAAAYKLCISYRKGWGDLQKAEKGFGFKLLEKRRGGKDGGETVLTQAGEDILIAYKQFRSDLEKSAEEAFEKHIAPLGNPEKCTLDKCEAEK
jgi:molybdate transport system regulatory protein